MNKAIAKSASTASVIRPTRLTALMRDSLTMMRCVEGVLERGDDLLLGDRLTIAPRVETHREMKRVGQRHRNRGPAGALFLYRRPFLVHRGLDVAADQPAQPQPEARREVFAQQHERPQCARLVIDRLLGTVDISPHASGQEPDDVPPA